MMQKSNYPTKFLKVAFTYLSSNLVISVFSLVRKLRSLHSVLVFSSSLPFLRATPIKSRSVSLVNNTTQGITQRQFSTTGSADSGLAGFSVIYWWEEYMGMNSIFLPGWVVLGL